MGNEQQEAACTIRRGRMVIMVMKRAVKYDSPQQCYTGNCNNLSSDHRSSSSARHLNLSVMILERVFFQFADLLNGRHATGVLKSDTMVGTSQSNRNEVAYESMTGMVET